MNKYMKVNDSVLFQKLANNENLMTLTLLYIYFNSLYNFKKLLVLYSMYNLLLNIFHFINCSMDTCNFCDIFSLKILL